MYMVNHTVLAHLVGKVIAGPAGELEFDSQSPYKEVRDGTMSL